MALTDAQARAAVLGAPDGKSSLPGPAFRAMAGCPVRRLRGTWASAPISDSNHVIAITSWQQRRIGSPLHLDQQGGNLQLHDAGASDDITVDQRPYAGVLT